MKKPSFQLCIALIIVMSISSCGGSLNKDSTKNIESSKEVIIGNQVWMTKNLNVDRFRNGDLIPEARNEKDWEAFGQAREPAWCYYENDPKNGDLYGKLYNWHAVNDPRGLAPIGWHIPSNNDWNELTHNLGGENIAGSKMKSKYGWKGGCTNGTNSSGFTALPGGRRYGWFIDLGKGSNFWSSTENSEFYAFFLTLNCISGDANIVDMPKETGRSVRCLRD